MSFFFNPFTSTFDISNGASIGSTISGATSGSVLFVGGSSTLAQDNTNFNYNSTTHLLQVPSIDTPGTTLAFGTLNATTINIGNSGCTVNIQGSTIYENVTQLQVKDPLITLNKGGGAGSAANSGIELEENGSITSYVETSADRNSWTLKAPATTGIVTITPGSSGFTINQGSHNPVTFAIVGSTPNTSGASLSSQQITLQPADGSNPGLITAGAQTIGGAKTFSGAISASNLSGTNTGDQTITLIGDVTGSGTGSFATTIASGAVSNSKMANMAAHTFKGNNTGSSVAPLDLTATQLTAELNNFVGDSGSGGTKGLVPAPASGDGAARKFLCADGTWANTTDTGVISVGTIDSQTASSDGLVISGKVIYGQSASTSNPGMVNTTTQSFAGNKTFTGTIAASNLSGTNTGDLTLAAVGSTPNNNGASISSQTLTLQPADGTHPGVVTTGAQTIAGAKTLSSALTITPTTSQIVLGTTRTTTISALQPASSATYTIADVGTSDTFTMNAGAQTLSNKNIDANSNTIVNIANGNLTGAAAISNANLATMPNNTVKGNVLGSTATPTDLTKAQLLTLLGIVTGSAGDISETTFTAADNQAVAANVTGFSFANATVRSFSAMVSVTRASTYAIYELQGVQRAADWVLNSSFIGDTTGITFSISTAGQIKYTTTSTGSTAKVCFRSFTTTV